MTQLSSLQNDPASIAAPPPPAKIDVPTPQAPPRPVSAPVYPSTSGEPKPPAGKMRQFGEFLANVGSGNVWGAASDFQKIGDGLDAAWRGNPTSGAVRRFMRGSDTLRYPPDPSFRLTEEAVKPLTEGIDQDLWDFYGDAHSADHLQFLYATNLATMERRNTLRSAGWAAIPARILAETLDPATLGVTALTGGLGTAGVVATRGARLAQLAKAGLVAGVPLAGLTAARSTFDPNIHGADIAAAGVSGFGFGVGSALTQSSGAVAHGLAAGFGGAVPTLGVDLLRHDQDSNDALIGFTQGFLTGAIGAGLSRAATGKIMPIMAEQNLKARLDDVPELALLTPEGRKAFAKPLDPNTEIERINTQGELLFGQSEAAKTPAVTEPPAPKEPAPIVESRGTPVPPKESTLSISERAQEILDSGEAADLSDATMQAKMEAKAALQREVADAAAQLVADEKGAMGAAASQEFKYYGNRVQAEGKAGTDFEASFIGDDRPAMAKLGPIPTRWGINAALSNSDLQSVRRFGNIVAFDNLPKKNGRIYTAGDMWAESGAKDTTANLFRGIEQDYIEYRKAGGTLNRNAYSEEISKAVRRGVTRYQGPEQIKNSAKRAQSVYAELLALQERHGVKGAAATTAYADYFTRRWLHDKIDLAIEKHGTQKILDLLAGAIEKRNADWATPKQITAMATAIVKNGGRPAKHSGPLGFLEGSLDDIAADLAEANIPEGDIAVIMDNLKAKYAGKSDAGAPRNLKYRIDMDETHAIGEGKDRLSIEDLLDNNAHRVLKSYIRNAWGNAAGAETLRVLSPDPENPISFTALKERVRTEAKARNADMIKTEGEIKKMEAAWRNMVALPLSDDIANSRLWKASNILRSGLSSSMLGNWYAGLTNAAEPLAALARPDTLARLFPALEELRLVAKDGKPSNASLRTFQFLTGRGADSVMSNVPVHIPVHGQKIDIALAKGQSFAQSARVFSGKLSGMSGSNDWGYRALGFGIVQKWGDWATSGKMPPKAVIREFGFENNEGLLQSVLDEIKTHAESVKGDSGVKMWDLHPEKWTDLEAMSAFRAAVYTESATRFVNPLPNQLSYWMGTELGKPFAQFRTFNLASWDSKLLQGLNSRNIDHLRMFVTNAGMTAALYSLKVYTESLGRDDAQEYRDKMLDASHVARVAFSRSAYMSLVPAAVDTVVTPFAGESVFGFGRSSGIQGASPPMLDWAGNAVNALGGAIRHGYEPDYSFSMQDLRSLRRSIPFIPQVEPLVKGIDMLGRNVVGLPETSRE